MTDRIRMLVIDDHTRVHMNIRQALAGFEDLDIVAHGSNGEEALQLCLEYHPDVVLMDVIMPGMNGIEATQAIRAQFPDIKSLALSSFQDDEAVRAMLQVGAIGYMLKAASIDDLAQTIRTAYSGQSVFSPEIVPTLLNSIQNKPLYDFGLTARERDVLELLVNGLNNTEIADTMSISLATVKSHVSNIFVKLGVTNRVEAVALAVGKKLLN